MIKSDQILDAVSYLLSNGFDPAELPESIKRVVGPDVIESPSYCNYDIIDADNKLFAEYKARIQQQRDSIAKCGEINYVLCARNKYVCDSLIHIMSPTQCAELIFEYDCNHIHLYMPRRILTVELMLKLITANDIPRLERNLLAFPNELLMQYVNIIEEYSPHLALIIYQQSGKYAPPDVYMRVLTTESAVFHHLPLKLRYANETELPGFNALANYIYNNYIGRVGELPRSEIMRLKYGMTNEQFIMTFLKYQNHNTADEQKQYIIKHARHYSDWLVMDKNTDMIPFDYKYTFEDYAEMIIANIHVAYKLESRFVPFLIWFNEYIRAKKIYIAPNWRFTSA
jgi:hypothetical protein